MPFYDKVRIGSIFREPRNRPARFNPQMIRVRIREFSTQFGLGTGIRRRFRPLFQPNPKRRVVGQPLPPKWMSKGFRASR